MIAWQRFWLAGNLNLPWSGFNVNQEQLSPLVFSLLERSTSDIFIQLNNPIFSFKINLLLCAFTTFHQLYQCLRFSTNICFKHIKEMQTHIKYTKSLLIVTPGPTIHASSRAWLAGSEQLRRVQDQKYPIFSPLLILSQRYDIQYWKKPPPC